MAENNPNEESPVTRNTVTLYFDTVNGRVSTTLNADLLETEDMFMSQDPDLCAPGPNDPQQDSDETPDIDLHASMELPNDPEEDSDETPDLDIHASMELSSHASMELSLEEDDGPEPTNRMSDHPISPELQSGSGARKKEVGTPARTTDSDCDSKSKYDHQTPSSDDEDENLPIRPSDYPGVRPSRLCEYRKRLTPAEIESQDFIYEDMAPTVSGVRRKQYCTTATTTDSDSDVDYTEFPLNSTNHKLSNGKKDFTCLICKRRFCKVQSLATHVYWHTKEPQEEAQSETSEDVLILSSGAENDCL